MLVRGSGLKSVASQPARNRRLGSSLSPIGRPVVRIHRKAVDMRESEAKALLGLPANASPSQSEVKMAYRQKAWESHPDRFPPTEKYHAESKFKLVSEAYSCLKTATRPMDSASVCYRTGFPQKCRGGNHTLIKYPFAVLILGTVFLGGFHASRAYQKQKRACPSHNPFLP